MNTAPKGAITALDILDNPNPFEPSVLSKWYTPGAAGTLVFLGCLTANYLTRRPVMSGIHITALATGVGVWFGTYLDEKRNLKYATRDAALRHYIQLHPEDFPPIDRKQYKDILDPWYPCRT